MGVFGLASPPFDVLPYLSPGFSCVTSRTVEPVFSGSRLLALLEFVDGTSKFTGLGHLGPQTAYNLHLSTGNAADRIRVSCKTVAVPFDVASC